MIGTDKILPGQQDQAPGQTTGQIGADDHACAFCGGAARALAPAVHPMNDFFDDGHHDTHAWSPRG